MTAFYTLLCNTKLPTSILKSLTHWQTVQPSGTLKGVAGGLQHNWRTQALFSVSSPRKRFITMLCGLSGVVARVEACSGPVCRTYHSGCGIRTHLSHWGTEGPKTFENT